MLLTGHRPQSLPFGYNESDEKCILLKRTLREVIEKQITENGVTGFISGMALGVDVYAAEILLGLKAQHPQITLECAVPCENQAEKWREADRARYYNIIHRSDRETILQTQYTPDCMQRRNQYMVDHSDVVIAVWNGKPSGTGNTVSYAKQQGKTVVVIHPVSLKTEYGKI